MQSNQPAKIIIFGDVAVPTGFGRIGAEVGRYLVSKGYSVVGACLQYDGLLPAPTGAPFFISALQGKDPWQAISGVAAAFRPDVILSLQDLPYNIQVRQATTIDWSTVGHVVITPVDGTPIASDWLKSAKDFDALLTISEYGVDAFREAGLRAALCAPGVNTAEFHPLTSDERTALRARIGIPADAFVVGMMAMNQGRKDFPHAIEGFARAFMDVPNAYLYLDCEKVSPAGWQIPQWILPTFGLSPDRVRFREDAMRAGIMSLNERYNLLDQHMVIAHREGFGLPHIEAMAAGIPSAAIEYCSGREVTQDGTTGLLIKARRGGLSTWGGSWDFDPEMDDLIFKLRWSYEHPAERLAMGARGLEYAKTRTWEKAAAVVEAEIAGVLKRRATDIAKKYAQPQPAMMQPTAVNASPDGINYGLVQEIIRREIAAAFPAKGTPIMDRGRFDHWREGEPTNAIGTQTVSLDIDPAAIQVIEAHTQQKAGDNE